MVPVVRRLAVPVPSCCLATAVWIRTGLLVCSVVAGVMSHKLYFGVGEHHMYALRYLSLFFLTYLLSSPQDIVPIDDERWMAVALVEILE